MSENEVVQKAKELYEALKYDFCNTLGDSDWCYKHGARTDNNNNSYTNSMFLPDYSFDENWWLDNELHALIDDVEGAESDIIAIYNNYFKKNFPQKCTCDSWNLLHFGCKCGYVAARKAAGLPL